MTLAVSGTTNRITTAGFVYDANGNLTQSPGVTYTYDAENRLAANPADGIAYSYGPDNRRVWDGAAYTFWSVSGRPIGRYRPQSTQPTITWATEETKLWFGGKLIGEGSGTAGTVYTAVVVDRLGSVRVRGSERHAYWPYGQERTPTAQGRTKFGTYLRDASGLDYADQRYFAWQWGRFMTADPYVSRDALSNPAGWNRYSYVIDDPVNLYDPRGLDYTIADGDTFNPSDPGNVDPGTTSIGVVASPDVVGGDPVDPEMTRWAPFYTASNTPPSVMWAVNQRQAARAAEAEQEFERIANARFQIAKDCLLKAVTDHYGLTAAGSAAAVLGMPIPKAWLPPYRVIGNPYMSLASWIGHYIEITVPRIVYRGLGTTNLLRAVGRVSGPIGWGLLAVDAAIISAETWTCYKAKENTSSP